MGRDNHIKSLIKAISVLKTFAPGALELTPAEIAQKLKMPKSSVYRVLATLSYGGFIEQNGTTNKYKIGPALYALGSLYLDTTDVIKAAEPVVKTLNDLTGEALNVGILDNGNMILIMKEESKHAFRFSVHVGSSMPAYSSAIGKALLSELDDSEIDRLYPHEALVPVTDKTIKTKTELKAELAEIRKSGIAYAREESYEGVIGIGAPIRNASRKAIAAVSISIPTFRLGQNMSDRIETAIRMAGSLISYRLGYQDAKEPVRTTDEIRSLWQNT